MVGSTINHYKIVEKLGEGGMGVVYKAEDTNLKRSVALKFLRTDVLESEEHKARFLREAQAAAALDHPNICTVYEIGKADGQTFLSMAFLEGQTVKEKVKERPLKLDEALDIAIQTAQGLQAAHEKGIVHRDIKSANLMVTPQGQVKIMDFGLAQLAEGSQLTKTATILGTPAYMSPEQARRDPTDRRTDIWSLGVVIYEMVTGRLPFEGERQEAVLFGIGNEEPEPMTALRAGLPVELDRIVAKAMAKSAEDRYQHVEEMVVDLRALGRSVEGTAAVPAPPRPDRRKWLYAVAALIMLFVAVATSLYITQKPISKASVGEPTIAVLPFANLSGHPEDEYLSDGLAEEIINALTKVPGLRVAARTSAFAFRGKQQDIREIGAKLNVDHVLEGSVRQFGERIRVTAQLIKVSDGYHLWGERYERRLADVFAIQDEISRAIVDNLRVQFGEKLPLVKADTENLEAYNLYLKGRFHWNKRTQDGLARSKEYFEQAIALDPDYALAYAGLGSWHWMSGFFGFVPPREAMPKAKAELVKALALDDSLADAHAVMGCIRGTYEYEWQQAGQSFARAVELDPSSSFVAERYAGFYLRPMKRPEEAEEVLRQALITDPLSVPTNGFLGITLMDQRKYDQAIEQFQATIDMDPNFYFANFQLAQVYVQKGLFNEAILAAEKAVQSSGRVAAAVGFLGWAYAMGGQTVQARKLLHELMKASERRYVPSLNLVMIHIALGELEQAFERLEESIEQRNPPTVFVSTEPQYEPLRSDPRFDALMRRMNLEP